jgi:hypothetical protein
MVARHGTGGRTDTLPPAARDETLEYPHRAGTHTACRLRLYTPPQQPPVIVLTEDPENPGESITNACEVAHYLAWERCGRPWPCVFVEHYQGNHYGAGTRDASDVERWARLSFRRDVSGRPGVLREPFSTREGHFVGARWSHLTAWQFAALVGEGETP